MTQHVLSKARRNFALVMLLVVPLHHTVSSPSCAHQAKNLMLPGHQSWMTETCFLLKCKKGPDISVSMQSYTNTHGSL